MQKEFNTEYTGFHELLSLEALHNYNNEIVKGAIKSFNTKNQIIDFGAGIGTLSVIFRDKYHIDPLCIEIDKANKLQDKVEPPIEKSPKGMNLDRYSY